MDDNFVRMAWRNRDPGLDVLLDLDGQVFVIDAKGRHWVRFSVTRVASTPERPHGLKYSLTLHGPDGSRLIGIDNAHPVRRRADPLARAEALLITSTGWRPSDLIGSKMQARCLRIFGTKWTNS
jgi:hypothetical protein